MKVSEVKKPELEPHWLNALAGEFEKPYMQELKAFLLEDRKYWRIFPENRQLFNAFWSTPLPAVKVVILGQDPYHGYGQAHGLCFSVQHGVPPPPSLVNIFKEIKTDLGLDIPNHGCLQSWAERGVFLLNTVLTVREARPQSHCKQGWESFTNRVIQILNEQSRPLVFMLWGASAQAKAALLDERRHLVLQAPHPSPLSSYRGFFGCRHFSKANQFLQEQGCEPVDWSL